MTEGVERARLEAGAKELGLSLEGNQVDALVGYLDLLERWNAVYNLTAVRSREEMLTLHVLDSLALVPVVQEFGPRDLLDVGAGAGLPGIPIAIALPIIRVTMVDAVGKKVAFMNQAIIALKLGARAIQARVEALTVDKSFDCITARAYSSLETLVGSAGHLLAPGGYFLAMKGEVPQDELRALGSHWDVKSTRELAVPGLKAKRSVIVIAPAASFHS